MDQTPKDITTEILINLKVTDLLQACKTNKKHQSICKTDGFWKRYYKHHVNPKYEVNREIKTNNNWKRAFFENYSEERRLIFKSLTQDTLWNIHTSDLSYAKRAMFDMKLDNYHNYLAIDRKDNIITCIPFLLPEHFENIPDRFVIKLEHEIIRTRSGSETATKLGRKQYQKNIPIEFIKDQVVITYPFHHKIDIDAGIRPADTSVDRKSSDHKSFIQNGVIYYRPGVRLSKIDKELLKEFRVKTRYLAS